MKTVHINAGNEFGGGLVHIVSLLCALEEKGQSVELIVLEDGPVAQAARQRGLKVIVFEQKSRYDLRVLARLLDYVNSEGFDIIHTHGPRANLFIRLLRPFIKAKWVTTIHSNPYHDFEKNSLKGKVFEKINTTCLTGANGVIAVSKEIKDIIIDLGVQTDRITVINNGIDFSAPKPIDSSDRSTDVFSIITIGRLHPIKNHDLLFDALSDMKEFECQVHICGEGEEYERLKVRAEKHEGLAKFYFNGWLGSDELKTLIRRSDLLVHTSRSESFPLVLLEAAEQEVAVISTNVGDVDKLLNTPDIGWLIKNESREELKSALISAQKEWQQGSLQIKGRQLKKAALKFSLSEQSNRVLAFYNSII